MLAPIRWLHIVAQRYHTQASLILLGSLVAMIVLTSIPDRGPMLRTAGTVVTELIILAAVVTVGRRGWRFGVTLGLALAVSVAIILNPWIERPDEFVQLAESLFFWFVVIALVSDVFHVQFNQRDRLLSAVNLYILAAIGFARWYHWLAVNDPSAYRLPEGDAGGMPTMVYFSFVTQTTLGYGDIAPVSAVARSLAFLQATLGLLYVAVVIAAIVGEWKPQGGGSGSGDEDAGGGRAGPVGSG